MNEEEKRKWAAKARAIVDKAEEEGRDLTTEEKAKADRFIALAKAANDGPTPTVPTIGDSPFGSTGGFVREGITEAERKFSLQRALRAAVTGDWSNAENELEAGRAIEERSGRASEGFYVPLSLFLAEKRDLTVSTEGTDVVPTDFQELIGPLANRAFCIQAGARLLTGLRGDVQFPRRTNTATVQWKAEGVALDSETTPTFSKVSMSPNMMGAYLDVTRQMLVQADSLNMEQVLRDDLSASISTELDRVCLHGSGSGAEPQGIRGYTGVGAVECGDPDGAAPDWGDIVALETEIAQDNADVGRLAYITNPKVRSKLRRTLKFGTDNEGTIWGSGPLPLNGYPAYATNQVASNLTKGGGSNLSAIFFGNWTDLIIGLWGSNAVTVIVDPYTGALSGLVRIIALLLADAEIRHPESFAVIDDAVTT
jgi:HK97 family phage major capsid protein